MLLPQLGGRQHERNLRRRIDSSEGTASSVTICEDKEGVDASTARAADWSRIGCPH